MRGDREIRSVSFSSDSSRETPSENNLFLLKDTIKIRQVIESALITDFCDRHGRIYQQPRSEPQSDVNDIIGKVLPCTQLKETAE